jgi:hypothetical protein
MSATALNPEQFHQARLFNPDNPPLAFSKEEGNVALKPLKEEMRRQQLGRAHRHNVEKHESSRP